jgi:hypothetical protein
MIADGASGSKNSRRHFNNTEFTMKITAVIMSLAIGLASTAALADLEPYKDYTPSDAIWSITTVKVYPNMEDAYLEGLKKTWVATNEIAKKLGQIEDYHIYRSALPASGSFNLLLVIKFKNAEAMGPNKARYQAFMKEWGEARKKEVTETAQKAYPNMRDITGEYAVNEITFN